MNCPNCNSTLTERDKEDWACRECPAMWVVQANGDPLISNSDWYCEYEEDDCECEAQDGYKIPWSTESFYGKKLSELFPTTIGNLYIAHR
jgi:Zn-finger nucleic acid-binding protein